MDLFEHQAKELFARHGVAVPRGRVAWSPEEAAAVAAELGGTVAVKAQVQIGGRGKAGGIIPRDDIALLKQQGVAEIFTPGTPTQRIVEWLRAALDQAA